MNKPLLKIRTQKYHTVTKSLNNLKTKKFVKEFMNIY